MAAWLFALKGSMELPAATNVPLTKSRLVILLIIVLSPGRAKKLAKRNEGSYDVDDANDSLRQCLENIRILGPVGRRCILLGVPDL